MASKRSRQAFEADLQKQESPFVFYGTPLPPLDDQVRDDGSFVPIWKQEVTDDRGRKRLHGAFTGGFSAGYYNTVGSKEGWTPSTFVSSRQNRMKDAKVPREQKPEDFMDEEDIREAEESRQLQTSDGFAGFGTEHDESRKNAAMDIFRPPDETMGVKLLKRMGWREGQGIGTRVRRRANLDDEAGATGEMHSFAPQDAPAISFTQKSDRKGLGYEDNLSAIRTSSTDTGKGPRNGRTATSDDDDDDDDEQGEHGLLLNLQSTKSKKKPPKSGFGVGVLNDTGSDDEDPYSMGPKISHNKVIGGEKKKKKKAASNIGTANPLVKAKPVFISKKLSSLQSTLKKCHDGRLPLDGFVLADELDSFGSLSLTNDKYRPPEVPAGWQSSYTSAEPGRDTPPFVSVAEAARGSLQDSRSRASALGEAPLPGKSVFDFLTPAARDRLATASGKSNLPPGMSERPPPGYEPTADQTQVLLQELVPKLEQDVALQALNRGATGWMPYAEDDAKRTRYRTYLEIRAGLRSTSAGDELPPRALGMSQDDWVVELHEFARAAQVFRPITGLMASRFTSSTSAIPQSSTGDDSELLSKPAAKPENPADAAARMGMFGPLTRSSVNFYPTRLVCKRFNVPMPEHVSVGSEASSSSQTQFPAETLEKIAQQQSRFHAAGSQSDTSNRPETTKGNVSVNDDVPMLEAEQVDPERNEALEREKPGHALFKAIFGSDDEDDDDDDDDD